MCYDGPCRACSCWPRQHSSSLSGTGSVTETLPVSDGLLQPPATTTSCPKMMYNLEMTPSLHKTMHYSATAARGIHKKSKALKTALMAMVLALTQSVSQSGRQSMQQAIRQPRHLTLLQDAGWAPYPAAGSKCDPHPHHHHNTPSQNSISGPAFICQPNQP